MARSRTLTSLLDDVRKRADIESVTDRFPDSELTEYINQSIARLYAALDMMDHTYYRTTTTITTVAQVSSYDLPDDFWHLKHVSVTVDGQPYIVKRYNPMEGDAIERLSWQNTYPQFYELVEDTIEIKPTPAADYDMVIYYSRAPQRLSSGSATFNGVAGFEEWVVLNAAIKVRRKNRQDASDLVADAGEVWAWIESTGNDRDHGQAMTIADGQSVMGDEVGFWPIGRG